jgi:hypothetical protein
MKALKKESARENNVGIDRDTVEIAYENVNSVQSSMGVCGDRRTFSFHNSEFLE